MAEDDRTIECDTCGRALKPHLAVTLYGDDAGVTVWAGGPYGSRCAENQARERWKAGLMTYRTPPGSDRRPYRFPGVAFGGPRTSRA